MPQEDRECLIFRDKWIGSIHPFHVEQYKKAGRDKGASPGHGGIHGPNANYCKVSRSVKTFILDRRAISR